MIGLGGVELMSVGGDNWTPITAAAVIKATPGRLCRILVSAPGSSSGVFTFNDCAATADATTANTIFTIAFGSTSAGAIYTLEWPCKVGVVCSAVPGAGSPRAAVSWV